MVLARAKRCEEAAPRAVKQRNLLHKKTGANYYGVTVHPPKDKGGKARWVSQITHKTTTHYMGLHETEKDAAAKYDRKCEELHLRHRKNAPQGKGDDDDPFKNALMKPSLYDGVSQNGPDKWRVQFMFKGTNYYLGLHPNMTAAADVYDRKCIQLGLRKQRPVVSVDLPSGGVQQLAKLMAEYESKKQALKKNKKNKYQIERSREQVGSVQNSLAKHDHFAS